MLWVATSSLPADRSECLTVCLAPAHCALVGEHDGLFAACQLHVNCVDSSRRHADL
jgi:hypothetical protein